MLWLQTFSSCVSWTTYEICSIKCSETCWSIMCKQYDRMSLWCTCSSIIYLLCTSSHIIDIITTRYCNNSKWSKVIGEDGSKLQVSTRANTPQRKRRKREYCVTWSEAIFDRKKVKLYFLKSSYAIMKKAVAYIANAIKPGIDLNFPRATVDDYTTK